MVRVRHALPAALVAAGLAFAGCLGSDDDEPSDTPAVPKAILDQKVTWKKCQDLQCASIKVPIDYEDPGKGTTVIKMARVPAKGGKSKGPLFLNPGGPGGSGIEEVQGKAALSLLKPDPLVQNYDLVGFDPRGVDSSSPVKCLDTKQLDEFIAVDVSPTTPAETRQARQSAVRFGNGCAKNPLGRHLSTVEVARDLDVMRHVLGADKLDYLGSSYGTRIGATYAALYPDRVGRMVLDGSVDPNSTYADTVLEGARGFDRALGDWAQSCVDDGECPLGDDADQVKRAVGDLLTALDEKPLPTGDPQRPLTQSLGFYGVIAPLYAQEQWPELTAAVAAAQKNQGQQLLNLADTLAGRDKNGYATNRSQMLTAVDCTDYQLTGMGDALSEEQLTKAAPTMGEFYTYDGTTGCAAWPLEREVEKPDFSAKGAAPIVVIGTTRDPATPYEWAKKMVDTLDSGVLLTREGEGHTGFEVGNKCIDKVVYAYFIDGTVPENGERCKNEPGDDRADKHPKRP